MPELTITSPSNPRLKHVNALRRRRERDNSGLTLIDGFEELSLAIHAGVHPRTLFWCPELMAPDATSIVSDARATGAETIRLSRNAFEKIAYREGPDGVLAIVPGLHRNLTDLHPTNTTFTLIAQAVEKPGNLGAMLRTCDAAGIDAFIAADPVTDWGNPNLIRSSKGTVFSVPVAADPTEATLQWITENNITLIATTPDTDTLHTDIDYTGPIAIAVGTEKTGLDQRMLAAATHRVRIPMHGHANSLNVSTSAAIVIYEAVRQRTATH
ncbi:TrmH family RNA methyltransferase [Dermatophilus congolensis]|uniref:TrmH family RNA methyltransferase n=1 Tax=Dermatophilus congolensis TaxID=1863 RepID=UPI001AAE7947|nr:RNA methyltransferase [Dermatophilus congolensis]MBO3152604.1 RNA methyltransferase [Dermatophilus congolensis]MBO3160385.1 RNA methyltransferase [Dermatophilus congolensis]MBO3163888.1 RNA methyltransferase [Dermatophilus congolensis]MBO3177435.1 RNA methyltransferase [Dermatophilus congolensis]